MVPPEGAAQRRAFGTRCVPRCCATQGSGTTAAALAVLIFGSCAAVGPGDACPVRNHPFCWMDPEFPCRRCCDTTRGPRGDAACWGGDVSYELCCDIEVIDATVEELQTCGMITAWLGSGLDLTDETFRTNDLFDIFPTLRRVCPAVAAMVYLASLAVELVLRGLREQSAASEQAEGLLHWLLDTLPHRVRASGGPQLAGFLMLFRIVGKGTTSWHRSWAEAASPTPVEGGALRSLIQAVVWQAPFELPTVCAAYAEAAPAPSHQSLPSGNSSSSSWFQRQPSTLTSSATAGAALEESLAPCASLDMALAVVAYADVARLSEGPSSQHFKRALQAVQRCLADVTRSKGALLPLIAAEEAGALGLALLLALDRLECGEEAFVDIGHYEAMVQDVLATDEESRAAGRGRLSPAGSVLRLAVLPVRDFESGYLRSRQQMHCGEDIQRLARRHLLLEPRGLFVDVGAYLGSCSLWAAAYDERVEALAIEPWSVAVKALRSSAGRNGLASRIHALRACVGDAPLRLRRAVRSFDSPNLYSPASPLWEVVPSAGSSSLAHLALEAAEEVACRRLDALVDRRVAVLRITVGGEETSVLATAAGLVKKGLLGAVVSSYPSRSAVILLWRWGFDVEVGGTAVPFGDEEVLNTVLTKTSGAWSHSYLVGVRRATPPTSSGAKPVEEELSPASPGERPRR
mmetsp:Transcript_174116/g.558282  ORF Transcript_174116/g.558282 Transcript_174116/m.558282 type:complete len:689 (+) Transcript_174116:52-2118(+)